MRPLFFRLIAALLTVFVLDPAHAETLRLNIVSVELTSDQRTAQSVLLIRVAPAQSQAVGKFTAARVGQTIDLRAEGRIVSSPTILEPILNGSLQISGPNDAGELRALGDRIRAGTATVELVSRDP